MWTVGALGFAIVTAAILLVLLTAPLWGPLTPLCRGREGHAASAAAPAPMASSASGSRGNGTGSGSSGIAGSSFPAWSLTASPNFCSMPEAAQSALYVYSTAFNCWVALVSPMQKLTAAIWPAAAHQRTWKPAVAALAPGALILSSQYGIAAIVSRIRGWQLTLPAAALYSNALAAAWGTLMDMGLNRGWEPWTCLWVPSAVVLAIIAFSWILTGVVADPWPLWAGQVVAYAIQIAAKIASCLATACEVEEASVELRAQVQAWKTETHRCWAVSDAAPQALPALQAQLDAALEVTANLRAQLAAAQQARAIAEAVGDVLRDALGQAVTVADLDTMDDERIAAQDAAAAAEATIEAQRDTALAALAAVESELKTVTGERDAALVALAAPQMRVDAALDERDAALFAQAGAEEHRAPPAAQAPAEASSRMEKASRRIAMVLDAAQQG